MNSPQSVTDPERKETYMDRKETIARIKTALQKRSGKTWSVTGGKGTAYGWLTIDAPPARCTWMWRLKEGATENTMENYEEYDTGNPGGHMSPADQAELKALLQFDSLPYQGILIMASNEAYREYIDRAEGRTPTTIAKPYWD